jgi:hypothetical protein
MASILPRLRQLSLHIPPPPSSTIRKKPHTRHFPFRTMSSSTQHDITLYTAGTPNGTKVSILLEELGLPYNLRPIDFKITEQKEPWYLKISPNGRIPAINDKSTGINLFESGAILLYLVGRYDKEQKFTYDYGSKEYWELLQWVYVPPPPPPSPLSLDLQGTNGKNK